MSYIYIYIFFKCSETQNYGIQCQFNSGNRILLKPFDLHTFLLGLIKINFAVVILFSFSPFLHQKFWNLDLIQNWSPLQFSLVFGMKQHFNVKFMIKVKWSWFTFLSLDTRLCDKHHIQFTVKVREFSLLDLQLY